MVSSHRRLVHRRNRQILSGKSRDLLPGEVRLFSFYAPALEGGTHTISVSQSISAPPVWPYEDASKNRRPDSIDGPGQTIFVVAPKFSLPPNSVDSVFPAPGTNAEVNVLPHIVLKDPHLPWERQPTYIAEDEDRGDERRRTPWMALLVFTVPELSVSQEDVEKVMTGLSPDVKRETSDTCTLRMRARDTPDLAGVTNAISYDPDEDDRDAAEPVDVVLLEPALFTALFSEDKGGSAAPSPGLRVSKYKHLAHVRETATDGMAVAGNVEDNDDDQGIFSVVVSPRTSTIGADVPTTTIVHLISLAMKPGLKLPLPAGQRVAAVSLHSWTYTCLPSKHFTSTFDGLVQLGKNLKVLQPQMPTLLNKRAPEPPSEDDKIALLITRRQKDGYTIVRHRTVTGETTAAMTRGPFTPTFVPHPLREGFTQSNFGTDLQILDPDLVMMDLTYSSAWQLGKALAMGDAAFSAALARLRSSIHGQALSDAKKEVHAALGAYRSRRETAGDMLDLTRGLNQLNALLHQSGGAATAFDVNRWHHADLPGDGLAQDYVGISRLSEHISTRISAHANAAAAECSLSSDGQLYNEYNMPNSPDYAHVYSWVLDKVHLGNIPAHYLIPDPSYLPEETLRFFHVDENWTDALVDGALSLANHWGAEPDKDVDRTAIKGAINTRLNEPDPALGGWHVQMPKYGFLLRSQILAQFPDLSVTVRFSAEQPKPMHNSPSQAPILVQKLLRPDTMYCLFDCAPPGLTHITFTLPPHQQRFVVGQTLAEDKLTVLYKKISTTPGYVPDNPAQGLGSVDFIKDSAEPTPVFDWGLRTMNVNNYGDKLVKMLRESPGMIKDGKNLFADTFVTSAVLALQLNDPILQLVIGDLNKAIASSQESRFQLSTPPRHSTRPPPLPYTNQAAVPRRKALVRPRPPSPRREAELVARHAAKLQMQKTQEAVVSASIRTRSPAQPSKMVQPTFEFKIYLVRRRDYVPSNGKLPVDLIFSIRQPEPAAFITNLVKLVVAVPYGKVKVPETRPAVPSKKKRSPRGSAKRSDEPPIPLLGENPDPPMPTMLSNMRFNIIKHWGLPNEGFENHLMLEVIPRAANGVNVALVHDASFLMSGAEIARYNGTEPLQPWVHLLQYYAQYEKEPIWGGTSVVMKADPKLKE